MSTRLKAGTHQWASIRPARAISTSPAATAWQNPVDARPSATWPPTALGHHAEASRAGRRASSRDYTRPSRADTAVEALMSACLRRRAACRGHVRSSSPGRGAHDDGEPPDGRPLPRDDATGRLRRHRRTGDPPGTDARPAHRRGAGRARVLARGGRRPACPEHHRVIRVMALERCGACLSFRDDTTIASDQV